MERGKICMIVPVHCVDCGRLIGEIDTALNKNMKQLDAPCGERVCESCCKKCRLEAVKRGEPCERMAGHGD